MSNLTTYLEKLHERGVATRDHTTLLLTCHTKAKDEFKISQFVQRERTMNSSTKSGSVDAGMTGQAAAGGNAADTEDPGIDVASSVSILHSAGFTGDYIYTT